MTPTRTAMTAERIADLRGLCVERDRSTWRNNYARLEGLCDRFEDGLAEATDTIDALHARNAALEAGLREAGEANSAFVNCFESDFVLDGQIVDDPESRWGALVPLYRKASAAQTAITTLLRESDAPAIEARESSR